MDIPRHWRLKSQRYSLIGEVCPSCDAKLFPPRDVCPECGAPAKTPFAFSGRGDAGGATGVYQIVEVVQQLRGCAGANQLANARIGMAQNLGATGATAVTHILMRDE